MEGLRCLDRRWVLNCIIFSLRFTPSRMIWRVLRLKLPMVFLLVLSLFVFMGSNQFTSQLLDQESVPVPILTRPVLVPARVIVIPNRRKLHNLPKYNISKIGGKDGVYKGSLDKKQKAIQGASNMVHISHNSHPQVNRNKNDPPLDKVNNKEDEAIDMTNTHKKDIKDKVPILDPIKENPSNEDDPFNKLFEDLEPIMEKPAKVIINGRFRTGSSFVGSYFQYHPMVHYLFEPLQFYPTPFNNKRQKYMERVSEKRLTELFNCNYVPLLKDVANYNNNGLHRVRKWWGMSFCRAKVVVNVPCPRKIRSIEQICKAVPHKVIKEITISNFTSLVPLMKSGVKVVHLVRDPRAQLNSIIKLYGNMTEEIFSHHSWKLVEICDDLRLTFQRVREALIADPSLIANYKLLRYEDIAMAPVEKGKELYKFTNIKPDKDTQKLLGRTTSANKDGSLSLSRNSSLIPFAWIKKAPTIMKQIAHQKCCDVLHMLGYPLIDPFAKLTEKDLKLQPIRLSVTGYYTPRCPYPLRKLPQPYLVLS